MPDLYYRCQYCGSITEAEAIRRSLYLAGHAIGDPSQRGWLRGMLKRHRAAASLMRELRAAGAAHGAHE